MFKPAICCIGYNRPESMRRLLSSIAKANYNGFDDITLIISIDNSNKSIEVVEIAKQFIWNYGKKIIKTYDEKLGLKKHVLTCGDLTKIYGSLIVLEDDLIVSPDFYQYTISALDFYGDDDNIFGISLYYQSWLSNQGFEFRAIQTGSDAFLAQISVSWGQCWINKQWERFRKWIDQNENLPNYFADIPLHAFDWNNKTSWSKYELFYLVSNNLYHVVPYISLTTNMGDVGSHTIASHDRVQTPLFYGQTKKYIFYKFEQCVIYDAFFERKDDSFLKMVGNCNNNKVLMDLNGARYDWEGFQQTYSIQKLPFEVVKTYGAKLDPIELNILLETPGDSIRLYKIPNEFKSYATISKIKNKHVLPGRRDHYLNKVPSKTLLSNMFSRIFRRLFKR